MNRIRLTISVVGLLVVGLLFALQTGSVVGEDRAENGLPVGTFVMRVYYDSFEDIETLNQLGLDVHEYNNLDEQYVLVTANSTIYGQLADQSWQLAVDEVATNAFTNINRSQEQTPDTYYGGYRTVYEMYNILQTTANEHPTITELFDYGDSYCKENSCGFFDEWGRPYRGWDLQAIRVANEMNEDAPIGFGERPVFFLMAAIHSRELTTSEQALFLLDYLVSNYGTDPDVTWLVDWHDIYIVPVANPDGRWIVENYDVPGSQRKNVHETAACSGWANSFSQPGVDLNRNHSHRWNTGGSSGSACSLTYRGTAAASEPEVDQLQEFVRTIIPDQRGTGNAAAPDDTVGLFITMHSYSDLVLWPWGYTTSAAPNREGLKAIGDKLGELTGYTSCQPSICLYNASGTTDDWSYGELGVPSFTYEIGGNFDGFFPSYTTASTTHWDEVRESLLYAARIAGAPYMQAHGPDVSAMQTSGVRSQQITLSATINDTQNGNNTIASAMAWIDTPEWAGGSMSVALSAVDGSFNETVEQVTGTIDACVHGLSNGTHTAWIHGTDSSGNTGPVWATEFEVANCTPSMPTAVAVSELIARPAFGLIVVFVAMIALIGVTVLVRRTAA